MTISIMSLGLANQSVLSVYRNILSRDCLGTLFFQILTIDRKKVIKVGILHVMDMFWLPEHHTIVDQQLYALRFIYCIVKSAEK